MTDRKLLDSICTAFPQTVTAVLIAEGEYTIAVDDWNSRHDLDSTIKMSAAWRKLNEAHADLGRVITDAIIGRDVPADGRLHVDKVNA